MVRLLGKLPYRVEGSYPNDGDSKGTREGFVELGTVDTKKSCMTLAGSLP